MQAQSSRRQATSPVCKDQTPASPRSGVQQVPRNKNNTANDERHEQASERPTAPCTTWGPVRPKERGGYRSGRTPWASERENEYKIRFDMPGMTQNDVKIWVEQGNMLVIQAEKIPNDGDNQDGWWPAKSFGRYHTQLALPDNVDFKNVKAEVKDGVLYITIPKGQLNQQNQHRCSIDNGIYNSDGNQN